MRPYRIAALVLGSSLFFPVSCTTGLVVGTKIIAKAEARNSLKGDTPHPMAYMVASLPNTAEKIKAFPLSELDRFKALNPQASFLLPAESASFAIGTHGATVSYVAHPSKPAAQIVEVTLHDDTGTFFRYEATEKAITPMYTELWYHGYMFGAVPYALAFAVVLYIVGKIMRRKVNNGHQESS